MAGPLFPIQPTFSRGEISPRLYSRADIEHWRMALAECVNWIVLRQGGLRRRPPTEFINEIKDSSKRSFLRRFVFSVTQAYMLEFGDRYIRFYANQGIVETSPGVALEVVTPYLQADLFNSDGTIRMQFAQSADVLYIAHPDYPPMELRRLSASSFELIEYNFEDGPWYPENKTPTVMDPDGTSGAINIVAMRDLIPKASAQVTSGVTITANSQDRVFPAWKACDDQADSVWRATGGSAVLSVDFGSGNTKTPTSYAIQAALDDANTTRLEYEHAPKDWVLAGSVDGITYVTLDAQTGQTFTSGEVKSFPIAAPSAYRHFRLSITANVNGPVTVAEFTLSAPSTLGVNSDAGFDASYIGRHIGLRYGSVWYWGRITAINSTSSVAVTLETAIPGHGPTGGWRQGAWSEGAGYPGTVTFYQQRLVWGRTDSQPQTLWMSKAGDFDNFGTSIPAVDDDGITLTILAGEQNAIQWLAEGRDLLIGTTGAARSLGRSDSTSPFSAVNLEQERHTTFGSRQIQPVQVGNVTLYPSYYGRSMREMIFSFQTNSYIAPDVTILSEHMLRHGIVQFDYAQDPDSIVWCAIGNGELVGITYERDQQIVGMTRHRLGGSFAGQATGEEYGVVESVQTIPGADRSEVWMIVKRTINGTTKRYIELMRSVFEGGGIEDAAHLDCLTRVQGSAAVNYSGATYLAGQTIGMLANGRVETQTDVAVGGTFSLPSGQSATLLDFGLPYTSRGKTLPLAQGSGDGSGLGRKKQIIMAKFDCLETGQLKIGNSRDMPEVFQRLNTDIMGQPPSLRSGFYDHKFDSSWTDGGQITFVADGPLPATIRSLTPVFVGEP